LGAREGTDHARGPGCSHRPGPRGGGGIGAQDLLAGAIGLSGVLSVENGIRKKFRSLTRYAKTRHGTPCPASNTPLESGFTMMDALALVTGLLGPPFLLGTKSLYENYHWACARLRRPWPAWFALAVSLSDMSSRVIADRDPAGVSGTPGPRPCSLALGYRAEFPNRL
jgi:hypothetical protein